MEDPKLDLDRYRARSVQRKFESHRYIFNCYIWLNEIVIYDRLQPAERRIITFLLLCNRVLRGRAFKRDTLTSFHLLRFFFSLDIVLRECVFSNRRFRR